METRRNNRRQRKTKYIQLDTQQCKACWKCIEACPNNIFGRVNLLWHKHALIIRTDNCIGCSKCIKTCDFHAIIKTPSHGNTEKNTDKKPYNRLIINSALLLIGFMTVFSGLLIQFSYHIGQHGEINLNKKEFDLNYSGWTIVHKISVCLLSVLMICHVIQHWNWYKTCIKRHLIPKNKQIFLLTGIFIVVAVTGYIPWAIGLASNNQMIRKIFIEIHDKLALILFVLLILHILKRLKWFVVALKRILIH